MTLVKPKLGDISKIQNLLRSFVEEGIILKRDDDEIATNIRSYIAIEDKNKFIAIGALHIYSKELGEIRSLAVDKKYQKRGLGKNIVNELEREAKNLKLEKLLTLTYQKEFFEKLGFKEIPKEEVPSQKVWSDCIKCPHFPNCNEISLIKII